MLVPAISFAADTSVLAREWRVDYILKNEKHLKEYFTMIGDVSCTVGVCKEEPNKVYVDVVDRDWDGWDATQSFFVDDGYVSEHNIDLYKEENGGSTRHSRSIDWREYDIFDTYCKPLVKKLPQEVRSKFRGRWGIE